MGFSTEYNEYMQSDEWRKLRLRVLKRDRRKCVWCGSRQRLEVHHKTYIRFGNENMRDLITLCHECHAGYHRRKRIEQMKREARSQRKGKRT